ncbi:Translation initiation factor IF-2 [Mycena kentingensis (nom. inval.)]|nr:Translation initiation factor IF-2 [Mycena kentingensis (nom. inval.)]
MLTAAPVARRSCSVRSAATAAAQKKAPWMPQSSQPSSSHPPRSQQAPWMPHNPQASPSYNPRQRPQGSPPHTSATRPHAWNPQNPQASTSQSSLPPRHTPAPGSARRAWPSLSAVVPDAETRWTTRQTPSAPTGFRTPNARSGPLPWTAPQQQQKQQHKPQSKPMERGAVPHLQPHVQSRDREAVPPPKRVVAEVKQCEAEEEMVFDPEFYAPEEMVEVVEPEQTTRKPARSTGPKKKDFKERGSLLEGQNKDVEEASASVKKVKTAWRYVAKRVDEDVYIPSMVSVGHLARLLGVKLEELQDKMYDAGMGDQSSFDHVLTSDYALLLAEEFGRKPVVNDEAAFDLYPPTPHPDYQSLPNRPPVVTIMGHVDHGKTTLLDTLRSSSVAAGEVGGITQHIGAFSVPVPSSVNGGPQTITFLDTPGHAAFSAMRARGARVTDIIVLVVAADDGIMPQTKEVIELIKKDRDKVSVVVAINKVDKPEADIDAVQRALLVEDIHIEEMGGDIPAVHVSGLTGDGVPDLLDTISLLSEIQDVRAETTGNAFGYVLESKVRQGLGPVATILVLRGTLKPGAHIVCGTHQAKVRMMQDSNGKNIKAATPGMAVTVSGWKTLPSAGDEMIQASETDIKRAIANRKRKLDLDTAMADVEAINSSRQQERERRQQEAAAEQAQEAGRSAAKPVVADEQPTGPKELRLLIKADVSGSAEAVDGALQGIGNQHAMSKIMGASVGDISESDVMTAKATGATIVGFSVSASRNIEMLAARNDVPIITSDIIYRLMETVREKVIKMLPSTYETKVHGEAKVLQLFEVTVKGKKLKTVAGSRVTNGMLEKAKKARVMRKGEVIYEGTFETMRHFKDDVTELRKGNECGLNLNTFDDLRPDDIIQAYELIEKPGVL